MTRDPQRIDQALRHIRRITADNYPVIMGNSAEWSGAYRIAERQWQDMPEPGQSQRDNLRDELFRKARPQLEQVHERKHKR